MAAITLIQGDTISEVIRITDITKSIIDISGGTVKFRIVEELDDLKAAAIYNNDAVTISNGPAGEATLSIDRSVSKLWTPGRYKWEVEYTDTGSNVSHTLFAPCTIVKSIYSDD